MYAGKIVETGTVAETLLAPKHPYTEGLHHLDPVARREGPATQRHPGHRPEPLPDAEGLPVRAALPVLLRALQAVRAGAGADRGRPSRSLLARMSRSTASRSRSPERWWPAPAHLRRPVMPACRRPSRPRLPRARRHRLPARRRRQPEATDDRRGRRRARRADRRRGGRAARPDRAPQEVLPDHGRDPPPQDRRRPGRRRRELRGPAGRGPRARRRVGLRQDDARPDRLSSSRADRRQGVHRRHRPHHPRREGDASDAGPDADHLPGPLRIAEPADAGVRHHRRGTPRAGASEPQAAQQEGRGRPRAGRPAPRLHAALSARVLRRPAAADRDRPGARPRSRVRRLRRGRLRARRVDPEPDPEHPARPSPRARADLPVHRPQSVCRPLHQRSGRCDVPRQARRARRRRRHLQPPPPPVHDRVAVGRAGSGPADPQEADHPHGRRAVAGLAAVWLPVPYAVLAARTPRQPGELRPRGAAAARRRRRPAGRLPLGGVGDREHDGEFSSRRRSGSSRRSPTRPRSRSSSTTPTDPLEPATFRAPRARSRHPRSAARRPVREPMRQPRSRAAPPMPERPARRSADRRNRPASATPGAIPVRRASPDRRSRRETRLAAERIRTEGEDDVRARATTPAVVHDARCGD